MKIPMDTLHRTHNTVNVKVLQEREKLAHTTCRSGREKEKFRLTLECVFFSLAKREYVMFDGVEQQQQKQQGTTKKKESEAKQQMPNFLSTLICCLMDVFVYFSQSANALWFKFNGKNSPSRSS